VKVGDVVPDVELMEGTPGTKINLAKELSSGRGIIVGVPAAYSNNASIQLLDLY
jgi:2-Cys peroxiredoxin 5